MRAKRTYLLSEEEAKMLISINWPRAISFAEEQLKVVYQRREVLYNANVEKKPLPRELFIKEFLDDSYFKAVRKGLNPYTHVLRRLIEQCETDPDTMTISESTLSQLKEIQNKASQWYKEFSKATSEYRSTSQMYKMTFYAKGVKLDFISILEGRPRME